MSLVWSWAQVTVILSVCVGFLQVLWFHPTFLKHAGQWIGYTKSSLGVIENLNVWCVCDGPFQGVFSHFVPSSSQDKGMNNQSKQIPREKQLVESIVYTLLTLQSKLQIKWDKTRVGAWPVVKKEQKAGSGYKVTWQEGEPEKQDTHVIIYEYTVQGLIMEQ